MEALGQNGKVTQPAVVNFSVHGSFHELPEFPASGALSICEEIIFMFESAVTYKYNLSILIRKLYSSDSWPLQTFCARDLVMSMYLCV